MQGKSGTIEAVKPPRRALVKIESDAGETLTIELDARWLRPS